MVKVKSTTKEVKKVAKKSKVEGKAEAVKVKKVAAKKAIEATKAEEKPQPGEEKLGIIAQFQVKQGDTGSPEVQVALLTQRIAKLVGHLKINPSDNHSRRGLLGIVSKRRRLLNYLSEKNKDRYKQVVQKLGLK